MSLFVPTENNRIGVTLTTEYSTATSSSLIEAVEFDSSSPFWTIHFGRKIENGAYGPMDDRGVVIVEEAMIRDLIDCVNLKREQEKCED